LMSSRSPAPPPSMPALTCPTFVNVTVVDDVLHVLGSRVVAEQDLASRLRVLGLDLETVYESPCG